MTDLYDEIMACHDSRDDVSGLTYEQGFRAAARLARTLDETRKATHSTTGSADGMIETRPPDGRRLENRLAELEHDSAKHKAEIRAIGDRVIELNEVAAALNASNTALLNNQQMHGAAIAEQQDRLAKHSKLVADVNNGYGGIRDQLTYLRKSHDALTETVEQQGRELVESLRADLSALVGKVERIEYVVTKRGLVPLPVYLEWENYPTPPQPTAAEGDEAKWEAVRKEMMHTYTCHEWPLSDRTERTQRLTAKATVAEAIRQGLAAMPIDPTDERLVNVVVYSVGGLMRAPDGYDKAWTARRILTAIAAAQQEGAK